MKKWVVTTTIWHYEANYFCTLCGHMIEAGDIMGESTAGNLICPYCGYVYSTEGSYFVKGNSTPNVEGKYLEGKGPNIRGYICQY